MTEGQSWAMTGSIIRLVRLACNALPSRLVELEGLGLAWMGDLLILDRRRLLDARVASRAASQPSDWSVLPNFRSIVIDPCTYIVHNLHIVTLMFVFSRSNPM